MSRRFQEYLKRKNKSGQKEIPTGITGPPPRIQLQPQLQLHHSSPPTRSPPLPSRSKLDFLFLRKKKELRKKHHSLSLPDSKTSSSDSFSLSDTGTSNRDSSSFSDSETLSSDSSSLSDYSRLGNSNERSDKASWKGVKPVIF